VRFVEASSPFCTVTSTGPALPGGTTTCTRSASIGTRSELGISLPANHTRALLVKPLPLTVTVCPPFHAP
jgi:hypothetical protein